MNMYDNRKDLLNMVRKYIAGNATPEEIAFLESYYNFLNHETGFTSHLQAKEKRLLEEQMEAGIWHIVDNENSTTIPARRLWLRIAAAFSP